MLRNCFAALRSVVFAGTFCLALFPFKSIGNNKIKVYFNHPTDTSYSTGTNAVYLNQAMDDTLIAYINRAQYTLDIAQYDYNQGTYSNIATAVNNAYQRGVTVRWIYDGSSSNTGLSALNTGIHTVGSPTTSAYGIMHNKFVVIDANSSNPADAILITGSADWSTEQFNTDYNNMIIFQDSALAHAYTSEFNMMWGSTTAVPNASAAKFGPYKTDLGRHSFIIGGSTVELYFSPSDGTETHIQSTINTANTDLYFGVYTFTSSTDANMIVSRYTSGVYVSGIIDQYSNSYSPYSIFTTGLGTHFVDYTGTGIYHNKYLIVDPSNTCSDPAVLTGSHNWTTSANTKNDENTVIVHDPTIANIYYQAFHHDFTANGGTMTTVTGCPTEIKQETPNSGDIRIASQPGSPEFTITASLPENETAEIALCDLSGRVVWSVPSGAVRAGTNVFSGKVTVPGLYVLAVQTANTNYRSKAVFVF